MSIFTLQNGTSGNPNYALLKPNKTVKAISYHQAGVVNKPEFDDKNKIDSCGIFEKSFDNLNNSLQPGEGVQFIVPSNLVKRIIRCKLLIDNPTTPANGLGSGSLISLGIATLDISQKSTLGSNNDKNTNTMMEGLPFFTTKLDANANQATDYIFNDSYFLPASSAHPTSPATKVVFNEDDMSNMFGFKFDNMPPYTSIFLFNKGGSAITEGRIRMSLICA